VGDGVKYTDMRKVAMLSTLFLFLTFAQMGYSVSKETSLELVATESAPASVSAQPEIEPSVDLTVPSTEKGRLERLLDTKKVEGWWGLNILKIAIRNAVSEGVSPNTIVILFLFPLVAALVSFSRQVIGISGFGIITPAMLSVAFLSTGGLAGLVLLAFILIAATIARVIVKKIKIPYLPKLSMSLWIVSMSVLILLLGSPSLGLSRLIGVGIFPILLFVLLAETFIEAQITRSLAISMFMTSETVVLALISYRIISAPWVQELVLTHPEISVMAILLVDYIIGRYKGLRLMEVWRFRKLISK